MSEKIEEAIDSDNIRDQMDLELWNTISGRFK